MKIKFFDQTAFSFLYSYAAAAAPAAAPAPAEAPFVAPFAISQGSVESITSQEETVISSSERSPHSSMFILSPPYIIYKANNNPQTIKYLL